jgi:hypothetical protein
MVSVYEILEYLFHNPDKTTKQIADELRQQNYKNVFENSIATALGKLAKQKRVIRESRPSLLQKNRTAYHYSLSEYSINQHNSFGNFFNLPFARGVKMTRTRDWVPDGTYFLDPCDGAQPYK